MSLGRFWSVALVAVVAAGSACGRSGSPIAPGQPSAPVPQIDQLRLLGVPDALAPGDTVQLAVEVVLPDGTVKDCAPSALWAVNAPDVAEVTSSGRLTARITGYVSVTVTCDGMSATRETKVEARTPYLATIWAYDAELSGALVEVTLEFLDGPRAGERLDSLLRNGIPDLIFPVRVRLTADAYETVEAVLADSTGERQNRSGPYFRFDIPMTFAGDAWTDTYVHRLSWEESERHHPLAPGRPGAVEVRTWWAVDYNDRLFVELWCDGTLRRSVQQSMASFGDGFVETIERPEACEVRIRQKKRDAHTHYRLAVRYAR